MLPNIAANGSVRVQSAQKVFQNNGGKGANFQGPPPQQQYPGVE